MPKLKSVEALGFGVWGMGLRSCLRFLEGLSKGLGSALWFGLRDYRVDIVTWKGIREYLYSLVLKPKNEE